ncbi:MAG: alpha/beta fold hydrolase [Gemmatimonadales bacterium]|nr:alpha/beta fold hydrolase [Gemmatimonadales bacterium]
MPPVEGYPFEDHYVEIEGHRLHYVDEGSGDPVLLFHGNPTWSFLYRKFIPEIAKTHRAVAPDYLGFGMSDKPKDGDYTIAAHIDRLTRFIEALGLEQITPVMQDWGGPIGFAYAVDYPDNIKRLVILNTSVFTGRTAGIPLVLRMMRAPVLGELLVKGLNLFINGFLRGPGTAQPISKAALAGYRYPYPTWHSRTAILAFPREISLTVEERNGKLIQEVENKLPSLKHRPALIIWGEKDPVFSLDDAERFRAAFPDHEFHSLPDASHYLQEDRPDFIVPKIVDFMNR